MSSPPPPPERKDHNWLRPAPLDVYAAQLTRSLDPLTVRWQRAPSSNSQDLQLVTPQFLGPPTLSWRMYEFFDSARQLVFPTCESPAIPYAGKSVLSAIFFFITVGSPLFINTKVPLVVSSLRVVAGIYPLHLLDNI